MTAANAPRPHPRTAWGLAWAAILAAFALAGCSRAPAPVRAPQPAAPAGKEKAGLESALEALHRGSDLRSCRVALKQLNGLFARQPQGTPPTLTDASRKILREAFSLDADELKEAGATDFTLLDAHHLHACLLLRDAARGLDADDLPALARAVAAFGWVTRQAPLGEKAEEMLPPVFALYRARATAAEQAVIFWELLRQLGVDGCAVVIPPSAADKGPARFWTAGAIVGPEVYLFDTRLGLPLPGPGGAGVATLRQLRAQPEILAALSVDDRHRYDITAEEARRAEIRSCCPLSALAPRMRYLQDLLPAAQRADLAVDAEALLQSLKATADAAGASLRPWPAADPDSPVTAWRRFLPPDEGGTDRQRRQARFEHDLVPWGNLPVPVRLAPADVDPGRTLRAAFQKRFLAFLTAPEQAHDHLLRGRLSEASAQFVSGRDELIQERQMYQDQSAELPALFAKWYVDAEQAYADLARASRNPADAATLEAARARLRQVWKQGERTVGLLLAGGAADPLLNLTTHFLAITKQEQAERVQAALERHGSQTGASPEAAAQMWRAAAEWWDTYLTENQGAPKAASARLFRARALEALGQRAAAAAALQDFTGQLAPLEQLGRLLRVRRIRQQETR